MRGLCCLFVALVLLACACSTSNTAHDSPRVISSDKILRVGVVTDYPPIVWEKDSQVIGLEADFAVQLAADLQMHLELEQYAWEDIFRVLDSGEIDIIMAGVSVTEERAKNYLFATPYMVIGQMAMIRTRDVAELNTPGALHSGRYRIGYVQGTTGEDYVRDNLSGKLFAYANKDEGINALAGEEIDFFIHDAPTVWQLANHHEAASANQLLGLYKPLTKEYLAWVMAKDNHSLKAKVNAVHQRWQVSGFLANKIKQWIPVVIVTNGG